jgi:hypothetical protein
MFLLAVMLWWMKLTGGGVMHGSCQNKLTFYGDSDMAEADLPLLSTDLSR